MVYQYVSVKFLCDQDLWEVLGERVCRKIAPGDVEKRAAAAPIAREFCGSAHRRIGQGETSTDFNLVALLRRPFAGFLEFQFEGSCLGSAKQDRVINYNSFDLKFLVSVPPALAGSFKLKLAVWGADEKSAVVSIVDW